MAIAPIAMKFPPSEIPVSGISGRPGIEGLLGFDGSLGLEGSLGFVG